MMKNLLLLFVLLCSFQVSSIAQISIEFEKDNCCVSMKVNIPPGRDFRIEMADGTFFYGDHDNNVFEHCYTEAGTYFVKAEVIDENGNPIGNGAGFIITITEEDIEKCEFDCISYLCWEDFIGYFKCATSITIELSDGSLQTLPFQAAQSGDAFCDWDQFPVYPLPASVPVPGGFCEISTAIINALNNAGFAFEFAESNTDITTCQKAGLGETPGFFIISSQFTVVNIGGDDCNGGNPAVAEFEDPECN